MFVHELVERDLRHVGAVPHEAHAHVALAQIEAGDALTHELPQCAVLGRAARLGVDDEHQVQVVLRYAT